MTDRCEPPGHLRGVDGWHWVQPPEDEPQLALWHATECDDVEPLWTTTHHVYSGTPRYAAREWGWRYHSPVLSPADVAALREERDAAVAARDEVVAAWRKFPEVLELAAGASPTAAVYKANALRWERDTAEQQLATLRAENARLRAALVKADEFITNGIELGFIRMPTPGTPDPALLTPGIIRAALGDTP